MHLFAALPPQPKTRLSSIEITPELLAAAQAAVKAGSPGTDRPKQLLRRASGHEHGNRGPGFEAGRGQGMARTPQERQEEYNRARERILGTGEGAELQPAPSGSGRGGPVAARPLPGAPGAFVPMGAVPGGQNMGAGGRGRGRKGGYRERSQEAAADPDYLRGMNR